MRFIYPVFFVFICTQLVSCDTKPQPLVAGKDACHSCRMPVADARFGAEIITNKGRIYKFDDINCMLQWMHKPENNSTVYKRVLVINYSGKSDLIDAANAVFLKSDAIRTPMNSGIAAFSSEPEAGLLKKDVGGNFITWQQLKEIH